MKVKLFMVLILAIALFMSACGKSDADLTKAANDKLAADQITGLTVAVKDGAATLTGEVVDAVAKSKAEASVRTIEGIKSIDASKVSLKPLPPVTEDKMIEGLVNESLRKKGITGVTVTASNGEITLSGTVDKTKIVEVMMAAKEANPKAHVTNNLNQ